MYVIDNYYAFPLLKTGVKKLFFCQELLKIYKALDFRAAPGSKFYVWWRHQKNADAKENFFIYFESIFDGA